MFIFSQIFPVLYQKKISEIKLYLLNQNINCYCFVKHSFKVVLSLNTEFKLTAPQTAEANTRKQRREEPNTDDEAEQTELPVCLSSLTRKFLPVTKTSPAKTSQ